MKNQILFAALAVLAFYASGTVIDPQEGTVEVGEHSELDGLVEWGEPELANEQIAARASGLSEGVVAVGNTLFLRRYFYAAPIDGVTHTQNFIYTNTSCRITAVLATENTMRQTPRARIIANGLARNTVTLTFTSARDGGFHYLLEIWGTWVN